MPSYEFQLSDYNRIMLRQFKFICSIVAIVAIIGLTIGLSMPKRYKTKAVVQADFELLFEGTQMSPTVTGQLGETLESVMTDIAGYRVLLKASQRLGLIADTFSVSSVVYNQAALMTMERLVGMMALTPVPASKRIEIAITSKNPNEAVSIADAVSTAYRDFAFENKSLFFRNKELRITEALEQCRNELSAAAQRMVVARTSRKSLMSEGFYKNQVKKSESIERKRQQGSLRVSTIRAKKSELIALREHLQKPQLSRGAGESDSIEHVPDLSSITELTYRDQGLFMLSGRLSELYDRRSGYLRIYTPSHPAVVAVGEQMLVTINEMLAGLDRSEQTYERENAPLIAQADTIDELLKGQLNDENALEWMHTSYQTREMMCEKIEAELTEVSVILQGLVPYIAIVAKAIRPSKATGPGMAKILAMSVAAGILLGLVLSIFREMTDRSLSTIEDVRRVVNGYPVLTVIPVIKKEKHSALLSDDSAAVFGRDYKTFLPILFNPDAAQSEAFKSIAAQLSMQKPHQECTAILVTSSISQEGKTFFAVNLALSLTRQGLRTTLVEADFRKPSAGSLLGLPPLQGLSHLLVDAATIDECKIGVADLLLGSMAWKEIVGMYGLSNFSFIPYGAMVPNSAELLSSPAMGRLTKSLRDDGDFLIFDAPCASAVFSDPMELARHCDGIIMVYRSDKAPRELLMSSIRRLEKTGVPILGLALNAWHDVVDDGG